MAQLSAVLAVTVDSTAADSTVIDMSKADGGRYVVPTGSSLTTITWQSSVDGTNWVAAYDENGSPITQTVAAARSYPIPTSLNAARFIRGVGNADGAINVVLKQVNG